MESVTASAAEPSAYFISGVRSIGGAAGKLGDECGGMSKEEWAGRLERVHVSRTDMNRLIMNYLVTGEPSVRAIDIWSLHLVCGC